MPASLHSPGRRTRVSPRVPLALATALSCLTCEHPIPTPPRGDRVVAIAVEPGAVTLNPGETQAFSAYGVTEGGDSIPGAPVLWQATGGTITSGGIYTAGPVGGTFSVTAVSVMGAAQSGAASVKVFRKVIAAIAVRPDTATVPVQGKWPFNATLVDSLGDAVSPGSVSWSSTNPAIATVDSTGLATGIEPGTSTITATAQGKSGSAVMIVTASGTGPWPNEPAGFTVISDQPWNDLTSGGWSLQFGVLPLIVPDLTAPLSPPNVLQITYPAGFASGSAPSTMVHDVPGSKQFYVGLWWKASNPWQGNDANTNKIEYVFTNGNGSIVLEMYGPPPAGPFELRVFPTFSTSSGVWLFPNVNHIPITLGQWHRIEWLLVYNTTTNPANGIVRWWLDGQLIGDYSNVSYPTEGLYQYKVAPVWGGVGGPKTETDYFWYDHIHLSGR